MRTILLIEDDPLTAEVELRLLEAAGFEATWVETRDAAATVIAESPPELILADFQLADGSAEDTIVFLRAYSSSIPVVVCAGSLSTWEIAAECRGSGFLEFLDKYALPEPAKFRETLLDAHAKFHGQRPV